MSRDFLLILPTSRAIRARKEMLIKSNSLLPKMITIADFESRAAITDSKFVDNIQRVLFLKEASDFKEFQELKVDRNLVKFYSQADDFFKFFQELSYEGVEIKDLYIADSYAEFDRDLSVLQKLLVRYEDILKKKGYTDRVFLPKNFRLNLEYINEFSGFYLELDGFLTNFELKLFKDIAKYKPFIIKIRTTEFNKKMIKSFAEFGIELEVGYEIEFDLSLKKIISKVKKDTKLNSELIKCSEHLEQIAIAFAKVEEMVQNGIDASKIALVVPDESIASVIKKFDRLNNFNLAMGISIKEHSSYTIIKQIYEYLKGNEVAKEFLHRLEFDLEFLDSIVLKIDIEEFFTILDRVKVPLFSTKESHKELEKVKLLQTVFKFKKLFKEYRFSFKEWLFLLLSQMQNHSIDDILGGKVTVLGVLETRGSDFDGVVIVDFNDSIVPSISNKDRFLNSAVRANAKLPTKADRENLQKNYYYTLLERAKSSVIIYQENSENAPSKFIQELELTNPKEYIAPIEIFYKKESNYNKEAHLKDLKLDFNAKEFIWSSARLKIFLECKRKFYYRYYKKLQEPKSDEINDGLVLHDILSKVLKKGVAYNSYDELKKRFLIELEKQKDSLQMLYKKPLWIEMLDGFLKKQIEHFNSGWQVYESELFIEGVIEGLKFSGRVDRVDKRDDRYLIIDYKSGSTKSLNSRSSENLVDFQMSIYDRLFNKSESKKDFAYIEILNGGNLEYLKAKEEKDKKLLEHIEYIKSLKSFEASRCENLQLCRNCSFRLLCHRGEFL